jgi:hypothetical protein
MTASSCAALMLPIVYDVGGGDEMTNLEMTNHLLAPCDANWRGARVAYS